MNHRTGAASMLVVGLLLAGCGDETEPTAATVTVTQPAPEQAVPTTEAITETEEPAPAPAPEAATETDVPATEATETESSPQEDLLAKEPELNERGNLVKEIGQLAGTTTSSGQVSSVFSIDDIVVDYECSEGDAPANGHYLGIKLSIETFPPLADSGYGALNLSGGDFAVIGPDGTRENDPVGNSYTCINSSGQVPTDIGPSEKVMGVILLDTQYTEGTLILNGDGLGTDAAWEWTYGQ